MGRRGRKERGDTDHPFKKNLHLQGINGKGYYIIQQHLLFDPIFAPFGHVHNVLSPVCFSVTIFLFLKL